ncbi:hypothetical protein L249_4345, partial [Ophiocordyceps polyrhachis-furcata BCC 54312]
MHEWAGVISQAGNKKSEGGSAREDKRDREAEGPKERRVRLGEVSYAFVGGVFFQESEKKEGSRAKPRPEYQAPVDMVPREEYETRLELISRIVDDIRSTAPAFELTLAMFSALMLAPLHCLQMFTEGPSMARMVSLENIRALLTSFLRGPGGNPSARPRQSIGAALTAALNAPSRSQMEKNNVLRRDGDACVVTGAPFPDVCHILPFSWSKSRYNCYKVQGELIYHEHLWGDGNFSAEVRNWLTESPGAADKSWNMICLSPSLHRLWGKALFGLKYLGQLPAPPDEAEVPVQLQFRWLRREAVAPPEAWKPINPEGERDFETSRTSRFLNGVDAESMVSAHFAGSARPVESGHVITIRIPREDVQKFIAVINIQWSLCQLAAMSAAAEALEDEVEDEEEDGESFAEILEAFDEYLHNTKKKKNGRRIKPIEDSSGLVHRNHDRTPDSGAGAVYSRGDFAAFCACCVRETLEEMTEIAVSREAQETTIPAVAGEGQMAAPTSTSEEQQASMPTAPQQMMLSTVPEEKQEATVSTMSEQGQQTKVTAEEQQITSNAVPEEGQQTTPSSIPQQQQGDATAEETQQDSDMMSPPKHEGSQQCPPHRSLLPDPTMQAADKMDDDGEQQAEEERHENEGSEPAAEDVTMTEELPQEDCQGGALAEPERAAPDTVATSELETGRGAADVPKEEPTQAAETRTETAQRDDEDGGNAPTEHAQAESTDTSTSQPLQEHTQATKEDEGPADPMPVDAPESPPSLTSALLAAIGGLEPGEGETVSNVEVLQNDEGEQPEWEIDSDPYESSSDSSSSDSESDDEAYELLGIDETMKLLMEMEGGSDDEGGKGGKGASAASARTKNEVPDEVIPIPDVTVTAEMQIEELGLVEHVVEGNIVVKAIISGEYQVLDTGSVLCTADRVVIGAVAETLGKVLQPMYTVRFESEDKIRQLGIEVGTKIFYPVKHALYVFTEPLKAVKGSDASNIHDEEVAANEMEFSDDEKEAEHKRATKPRNRNRNRGTPHPLRQETTLNYDDDVDGPYKPLSRPADFGTAAHEQASRSQPPRRGRRGGGGDRRGRGNRGRDQPREGFSLPPQMSQRQRTPPQPPPSNNVPWSSAFTWPVSSPWPAHQAYGAPAPAPAPALLPAPVAPGWPSPPPIQGQAQGTDGAYVNPALIAALMNQLQARNGAQQQQQQPQWQQPPGG